MPRTTDAQRGPERLPAALALAAAAELGEGPVWDAREGRLVFVDILGRAVHHWTPGAASTDVRLLPAHVGAVALTERGGELVALPDGLHLLDPDGGPELVAALPADPRVRANDGKVDPQGRFVIGTMAYDEASPLGALWQLEGDELMLLRDGLALANGLGWTADGSRFFHTDTPTRRIDAFAYDPAMAPLAAGEPFVAIEDGWPDGLAVDVEGGVWVALWGASAVHRFGPDGALSAVVELPVTQPTSCAFGGPDLDVLYVTSAWKGLGPDARAREPLAGSLFRVEPGVSGVPIGRVRGR